MLQNKMEMIEKLTGIRSSKKSYYVELKNKIRETATRNTQLEILNELARSINIDMSLSEIMDNVSDKLKKVIWFDRLSLYILESNRLVLRTSQPKEPGVFPASTEIPSDNSIFYKVVLEGRSLIRNEIQPLSTQYTEEKVLFEAGIRSILLAPITAKGKTLGVLVLKSKSPGFFTTADLTFVQQLTDQLAVSIKNSSLYGEVLKAKQEWESTFDAVTDLLIFIDADHCVKRFNKSVPAFYNLPEASILGKKCFEVFLKSPSVCPNCPAVEAMKAGTRVSQTIQLPTGQVLDVNAYPAYDESQGLVGAITYSKDITRIVSSFKLVALGEMAAGVAHELNSPLTAIIGDAQILLRNVKLNDSSKELLMDINNCGFRCRRIIQNLLAFSRKEEYSFEPVDTNEVVEKSLGLLQYQIEKDGVSVVRDFGRDLPAVMGDAQRLEQVIINLILNARDALMDISGKREIRLVTRACSGEVHISVSDTGKGIPPDQMELIFSPFFTTKKPGQGTGLGLPVSLGIVQSHGGRIEVASNPEGGACFTVVLPIHAKRS